jgi:hypothetical protein
MAGRIFPFLIHILYNKIIKKSREQKALLILLLILALSEITSLEIAANPTERTGAKWNHILGKSSCLEQSI